MRSSKSRSRNKSNRNRSVGNVVNRVFDSSGPEGKVRGTPQQIIDKYNQLARDAQLGNDLVAAENFQQQAEHYTRMLGEAMKEQEARREQQERERQQQQQNRRDQQQNQQNQPGSGDQPDIAAPPAEAASDSGLVETPESTDEQGGLVETPENKPRNRRQRRPRNQDAGAEGAGSDAPAQPDAPEAAE